MPEDVFCSCRGPDDGSLMIECNYCAEWFHTRCINIKSDDLAALNEYKCESCSLSGPNTPEESEERMTIESSSKRRKNSKKPDFKPAATVDVKVLEARKKVEEALTKVLDSNHSIAESIEMTLFEAFHDQATGNCGQIYKSKYLSLLFNLKDPKNDQLRSRIISGQITPVQLVHMAPAEMANEDLSQMIKSVRERSIAQAMLEDVAGAVFVKKTHKGEEPLGMAPVEAEHISTLSERSNILDTQYVPKAPIQRSVRSNWRGLVLLQDIANFEASASSIGKSHLTSIIENQLPASLHVSGRIAPSKASSYLESLVGLPSRKIYALRLDPVEPADDGSKSDPNRLADYLMHSDRWVVVTVNPLRSNQLRDLYMIPCSQVRRVRDFLMERLEVVEETALHELEDLTACKSFLMLLVVSLN